MKPTIFAANSTRWVRTGLGCCLLFVLSLTVLYSQQPPLPDEKKKDGVVIQPVIQKQKAPQSIAKQPGEAGAVEVAFTDGSNLKMQLREEKIALATPYGKLHIAVADIQRIEFATRIADEDAKQIKTAIADLGSSEFDKREAASTQLLKLREKGYAELLRAARQSDPEVVRRARELIQQISARVPPDQLTVRPKDVVYTADSMIAGRIESVSLKARTSQFGDVKVKLNDVRTLHAPGLQAGMPSYLRTQMELNQLRQQLQRERNPPPVGVWQGKMLPMKAK